MRGERVWLLEICPNVPAEVVANRTRAIVNQYFDFITRTPGPAQTKGVSSSRNQCAGKKPLIRRVWGLRVGAQTQLLASEHFKFDCRGGRLCPKSRNTAPTARNMKARGKRESASPLVTN